ncbi:hypothetical protein BDV35DRAFT_350355 [Aspergillus flavus]|uniref:Uncharacterized protein n=1 Tax=Aspergillus flavus TaxID=5059 RepID=A0A5N6GZC8_ASPFL|nr:hypothetical protein BDV35DRAFT_350355 [Aspergillus flavus]
MPSSDCLQPPLLPQERSIVKSYGGWTNFLLSYGLKPWNDEYAEGGLMILKGLVECYSDSGDWDSFCLCVLWVGSSNS